MPTYKNITSTSLYINGKIVEPGETISVYKSLDDDSRFTKVSDEPKILDSISLSSNGAYLSTEGIHDQYILTIINQLNSLIDSSVALSTTLVALQDIAKNHIADINTLDKAFNIQRDENGKISSIGLLSTIESITQQLNELSNQIALEAKYRQQEDAVLRAKIEQNS